MQAILRVGLWAARGAAVMLGLILIATFLTVARADTPPPVKIKWVSGVNYNVAPALPVLTFSIIIDKQWADRVGEPAVEWTKDMFTAAAVIYQRDVGVTLQLADVSVRDISNSNHPLVLLKKTKRLRSGSTVLRSTGMTLFVTTRDFVIGPRQFLGWASGPPLCDRYTSAVISLEMNAETDPLLLAHEIAHNFDVPHDGFDECEGEMPVGYIMQAMGWSGRTFSQCSLRQMRQTIEATKCLTPTAHPVNSWHVEGGPPPRVKNSGAFDGTSLFVLAVFTLCLWWSGKLR